MKNDELHAAALEIRILGAIVTKHLKRELEQRLDTCGASIGSLQFGVLHVLRHHHSTISELSREMKLEPATLVPVIDALEQGGLVKRGHDPRDRRRTPLTLTERGADLTGRVPALSQDSQLVKALRHMGDEKCVALLRLLRELTALLTEDESMVPRLSASVREQIARDKLAARKSRVSASN